MSRDVSQWHLSLEAGQLAIARSGATSKYHIVRLRERGDARDTRQGQAREYGGTYDFRDCWDGSALCGTGTKKVTFGNRQYFYFYWVPLPEPVAFYGEDAICGNCLKKWRAEGEPAIRCDAEGDAVFIDPPPFGWRVVPAVPHPRDVPPEVDIESVVDGTGKVIGERRAEVRRWQRGTRVVRVVHMYEEGDAHWVRYHDARWPENEQREYGSNLKKCAQRAHQLMAEGGN